MIATCIASPDERRRAMPADVLMPSAVASLTHAITIRRPPRHVLPWLAQMGAGRAGWYAYDFIDNGGQPSAEVVRPELQDIQPGDVMPVLPGAMDAFVVARIERFRDLVLTVPAADGSLRATWELLLEPRSGGRCRLLARARLSERWLAGIGEPLTPGAPLLVERVYRALYHLPGPFRLRTVALVHRLREARMLRGIKRRAERGLLAARLPGPGRRRLVDRLLPRAAAVERRDVGEPESAVTVGISAP